MVRWIFIVLVMCNGIYFLWQHYLVGAESAAATPIANELAASAENQLVLLSERPDMKEKVVAEAATQEAAPAAESVSDEPEKQPPTICWQIGPFKEEVSAKQVLSRLTALDINLTLNSVEIAEKPDYWVHIPPRVSRREAIKLLRELQAKNIDSFLITEGELANGISLGFFTQQDRAEKVHAQRKAQGYQAEIKTIPRTHTELWAIFDEGQYGELSDALWQKIIEGNQGLERRKNYCDKIASVNNID